MVAWAILALFRCQHQSHNTRLSPMSRYNFQSIMLCGSAATLRIVSGSISQSCKIISSLYHIVQGGCAIHYNERFQLPEGQHRHDHQNPGRHKASNVACGKSLRVFSSLFRVCSLLDPIKGSGSGLAERLISMHATVGLVVVLDNRESLIAHGFVLLLAHLYLLQVLQ